MVDVEDFHYWVQRPRFRLLPQEGTPAGPQWCEESAEFIEWADTMLGKLARDPKPLKIAWAECEVYRQYRKRYRKVEPDHQGKYNLDRHPCLHQAFLLIGDKLEDMELSTGIPELAPPSSRSQLQKSSACGASVEQNKLETLICEMLLDFYGDPLKLRVPKTWPIIVMPKEGEQPGQDPGENRTQPKHIGIPSHGAETLFRRDYEQALPDRVVELGRQLAEARQETKQAQAQLVETQREKAELKRQLTDRDHQLVEARQETKQAQDALLSLRKQKAAAQRDRRQNLGEQGRAHHAEYMREWRARQRQQGSP